MLGLIETLLKEPSRKEPFRKEPYREDLVRKVPDAKAMASEPRKPVGAGRFAKRISGPPNLFLPADLYWPVTHAPGRRCLIGISINIITARSPSCQLRLEKFFELCCFEQGRHSGKVQPAIRLRSKVLRDANFPPRKRAPAMPECQPTATSYLAAIRRPGCPACHEVRMLLSRLEPGPSGTERATFDARHAPCRDYVGFLSWPAVAVSGWLSGRSRSAALRSVIPSDGFSSDGWPTGMTRQSATN